MNRKAELAPAVDTVSGNAEQLNDIADLWSTYLGVPLLPHDVSVLMVLRQAVLLKKAPESPDLWVEMQAHAATGFEVSPGTY